MGEICVRCGSRVELALRNNLDLCVNCAIKRCRRCGRAHGVAYVCSPRPSEEVRRLINESADRRARRRKEPTP